jgi:hypothetical protein
VHPTGVAERDAVGQERGDVVDSGGLGLHHLEGGHPGQGLRHVEATLVRRHEEPDPVPAVGVAVAAGVDVDHLDARRQVADIGGVIGQPHQWTLRAVRAVRRSPHVSSSRVSFRPGPARHG